MGRVQPQLYADNLKCVSRDPGVILHGARFTTGYLRLVGQEPAPSKCVLLSTSREVRKDMKDWVLSLEGDKWSFKLDARDLGGHLDTTFRGWSSTLAVGVPSCSDFCSPSGFSWSVSVCQVYVSAGCPAWG